MNPELLLPHLSRLSYAYGRPSSSAEIRTYAEDFVVDEELSFIPDGDGEHQFLKLQKRNLSTEQVIKILCDFTKLSQRDIGYAGLKDRNAVCTQWFSLPLAKINVHDWQLVENDDLKLVEATKNQRKLRHGAIKQNRFNLKLRKLTQSEELETRLTKVARLGVPNYFGQQRFGRNEANLLKVEKLFAQQDSQERSNKKPIRDRQQRSMVISSARSYLFNCVLSARVAQLSWDKAIAGDVMMLNGTHSIFNVTDVDEIIQQRIREQDIHPTGPMWGKQELPTALEAKRLEVQTLVAYQQWKQGLELLGMKQERRSLRLIAHDLKWRFSEADVLDINFSLPTGCYATSVLREIALVT